MDVASVALLKAAAPLTVGTELAALLSGRLYGANAVQAALARLFRLGAVLGAVSSARNGLAALGATNKTLVAGAATAAAFAAQLQTSCFHWTGALYVVLRALGSRATSSTPKGQLPLHLSLLSIFAGCCGHNYLMTSRSDLISPYYVKLWLRVIPGYRTLEEYSEHFGSPGTDSQHYPDAIVGEERAAQIPQGVYKSFRAQLPFVAGLQLTSGILGGRKTLQKLSSPQLAMQYLAELTVRSIRSSVVLAALPFLMTHVPAAYAAARRKVGIADGPTPRAPGLHAGVTAVLSTAIFMVEPPARREIIVVYTWWRVFEAVLRKAGLSMIDDANSGGGGGGGGGQKRAKWTAEVLAAAGLVGVAAGICQPWT